MDEWDKIAERLLPYDANFGGEWARLRREAVAAELREMGEEIERLKALATPLSGPILIFCAECGSNISVDEDGLCISCGSVAIGQGVDFLNHQLKAERDAAYQEVERLRNNPLVDLTCHRCKTHLRELDAKVNEGNRWWHQTCQLIEQRDAAYLKGLEEAQKITARHVFKIGTLEYRNFEAVEAIQSKIDEAKAQISKD